MKRIITAALALLLCCAGAHAQLNVKSASAGPVKIAAGTQSVGLLLYTQEAGYLMYLKSSNRYDKSGYFRLGKELDGAIQTLADLRELCDTIGANIVTVESWPGRSCTILASDRPGFLRLKFNRNAGDCELGAKDIDIYYDALVEKKGQE